MNKEQMELLMKADDLPKNPCGGCPAGAGCLGCPKQREFDSAWKPYKEAGISDEANKIAEAHAITARMKELVGELSEVLSPEELKALKIPVIGKAKEKQEDADVDKSKTVCFTGRRPKDLWGYNPENNEYEVLTSIVEKKVEEIVSWGYRRFITGGAQGFDQVAFDAVDRVRRANPSLGIQNVLYAPCREQESKWAEKGLFSKESYRKMVEAATEVVYVHDRPYESPKDLLNRNHAMVDASSLCVALWPKENWKSFRTTMKSGTAECMRYADSKGLALDIIDPKEVEIALEEAKERDEPER